jgi:hypothetical protein
MNKKFLFLLLLSPLTLAAMDGADNQDKKAKQKGHSSIKRTLPLVMAYSHHASERMLQRYISRREVAQTIKEGIHRRERGVLCYKNDGLTVVTDLSLQKIITTYHHDGLKTKKANKRLKSSSQGTASMQEKYFSCSQQKQLKKIHNNLLKARTIHRMQQRKAKFEVD